jgi:hypothetical protein
MRFALWFGIAAFFIAGGMFNAVAHDANGVLGLAFSVGVAAAIYGARLQQQQEHITDNPGLKVYFTTKAVAFHRAKDLLLNHRYQGEKWNFSQLDAEAGRITATLNFVERMSAFGPTAQLPDQPRRITLNILVTSQAPGQTCVQLNWFVASSIHRDACNDIIQHIGKELDRALANQSSVVAG